MKKMIMLEVGRRGRGVEEAKKEKEKRKGQKRMKRRER